jgi:DNA-binding XRE family transcriptional regulator
MDNITLRFKEFMLRHDINNDDVAQKMSWNKQKVTDLKGGKVKISPQLALEFEEKFKLNPCWLFFGRGSMIIEDVGLDLTGTEKKEMTIDELYTKVEELTNIVSDIKADYGKK